ncbi:MAG: penicillin-binding protein activator LpoB, partial [Endomicrobia bacterium]|nr:penicillin-binding protein activator LpoB [Endomicrobiia bacterium]
MKKIAAYFIVALLSVGLFACSGAQVTRVDSGEEIDLSGYWNDTDSQLTSQEMIKDSLNRPWIQVFMAQNNNRKPRVIVG